MAMVVALVAVLDTKVEATLIVLESAPQSTARTTLILGAEMRTQLVIAHANRQLAGAENTAISALPNTIK